MRKCQGHGKSSVPECQGHKVSSWKCDARDESGPQCLGHWQNWLKCQGHKGSLLKCQCHKGTLPAWCRGLAIWTQPAGRPSPATLQSEGRAESTSSTSLGRGATSVPEEKQPMPSKLKKESTHHFINKYSHTCSPSSLLCSVSFPHLNSVLTDSF